MLSFAGVVNVPRDLDARTRSALDILTEALLRAAPPRQLKVVTATPSPLHLVSAKRAIATALKK